MDLLEEVAILQGFLELKHITQRFMSRQGPVLAVEDLNLSIREREFVAVVGPSGCGKSTLLNMVTGLFLPTSGEIYYRGKLVDGTVNTEIGYMTQQDTLLPWRSLLGNVELPLEIAGAPVAQRRQAAADWITRVGLTGFGSHFPHELSGGMRQRGRLARTLVANPQVILMDEPFGALDAQTRGQLQNQLLGLWNQDRKTILFITHDLIEAIALADRVVVMTARPGRIKLVVDVTVPRPRDVFRIHDAPGFKELYDEVWAALETEVLAAH